MALPFANSRLQDEIEEDGMESSAESMLIYTLRRRSTPVRINGTR